MSDESVVLEAKHDEVRSAGVGWLFGCSILGAGVYWHLVSRAWKASKHPTIRRTAPTTENQPPRMSEMCKLRDSAQGFRSHYDDLGGQPEQELHCRDSRQRPDPT